MAITQDAGRLGLSYTAPAGAIRIPAGTNIQSVIDKYPAGTAFVLGAGTHAQQTINPQAGDQFYGENGQTVLDGNGAQRLFPSQYIPNITVAGLKVTDYMPVKGQGGVLGSGEYTDDWKVLGNEFYGNGNAPFSHPIMAGDGWVVSDNYIHDNWWTGIGGWEAENARITNNEVVRNNQSNATPYAADGDAAGIKFAKTVNFTVANNLVSDNKNAFGVWVDIDSKATLIEGNRIERNGAGGIQVELDRGSIVRDNIVSGNNERVRNSPDKGGIFINNAQNAEVTGNFVSGNGGGIFILEDHSRGSGAYGQWTSGNIKVHDNTIRIAKGANGEQGFASDDATVNWFGNDYSISGTGKLVMRGGAVTPAQWQAAGHDTAASGSIFNVAAPGSLNTPTATGGAKIGTGSDTLVLKVSENAYNGHAQYTVKVDGVQIGGIQTAATAHDSGSDTLTVKGDWAVGSHTVAVTFLNDDWGGMWTADRNFYVDSATYNGAVVTGAAKTFTTNGTQGFTVTDSTLLGSTPALTAQIITGTAGADALAGGMGVDTLQGAASNNVLTGGADSDMFTFTDEDGWDRAVDFTRGASKPQMEGLFSTDMHWQYTKRGGMGDGMEVLYDDNKDGVGGGVFLPSVTSLAQTDFVFC